MADITQLNTSYKKKTITLDNFILQFRYNTSNNYFYFDLFTKNSEPIKYHNKIVTGKVFNEFYFTSSDNSDYATWQNIENFRLVVND